jgi:hypothetical protein
MMSLSLFEAWYRQLISDSDLGLPTHEEILGMTLDDRTHVSASSQHSSVDSENGAGLDGEKAPPEKKRKLNSGEQHRSRKITKSLLHVSPPRTVGDVLDSCPSAFFHDGFVAPRVQQWLREARTLMDVSDVPQVGSIPLDSPSSSNEL